MKFYVDISIHECFITVVIDWQNVFTSVPSFQLWSTNFINIQIHEEDGATNSDSTGQCHAKALKSVSNMAALHTKVGIAEIINYLFKLLSHMISFAHTCTTQLLLQCTGLMRKRSNQWDSPLVVLRYFPLVRIIDPTSRQSVPWTRLLQTLVHRRFINASLSRNSVPQTMPPCSEAGPS